MKLLLHKMWSDFRDVRWAWAAWCGVLLVQVCACGWMFYGLPDLPWEWVSGLLWIGQLAAGVVLVHRLFAIDPYQSPHAFWVSRPIRPGWLLAGKYGTALLALLVPMLMARFACQALVQLGEFNLGEWRWALLWVVFGTGFIGIIHWAKLRCWPMLGVCLLLAIFITVGPLAVFAMVDTWLSEQDGRAHEQRWRDYDAFAGHWLSCWFRQGGILLMALAFAALLVRLARKRAPLSLVWPLLGVPALNWLWAISGAARAIGTWGVGEESSLSNLVLKLGLFPEHSDAADLTFYPPQSQIPISTPSQPLRLAKGEVRWSEAAGLELQLALPEPPDLAAGLVRVMGFYIKNLTLPYGIDLPPDTIITLIGDPAKLGTRLEDLTTQGFSEAHARAIIAGAVPLSSAKPYKKFLDRPRSESEYGHLTAKVFRDYYEILQTYGPIPKHSGVLVDPGVRANWHPRGFSMIVANLPSPSRMMRDQRFLGVDFRDDSQGVFTDLYASGSEGLLMPSFFMVRSNRSLDHIDFSNSNQPRVSPSEPQQLWLMRLRYGPQREGTIEVDFEIPKEWKRTGG